MIDKENHFMTEIRSPISVIWRCSCGWYTKQTRRQNALARYAKLNAAWGKHIGEKIGIDCKKKPGN